MYVITGANGQTGSVLARTLLSRGKPVRVVLRRAEQAAAWRDRGADVCIADVSEEASPIKAFDDADAAYLMNPTAYQAHDLFASAGRVHQAMINAAEHVGMRQVVALSSVGESRRQSLAVNGPLQSDDAFSRCRSLRARLMS